MFGFGTGFGTSDSDANRGGAGSTFGFGTSTSTFSPGPLLFGSSAATSTATTAAPFGSATSGDASTTAAGTSSLFGSSSSSTAATGSSFLSFPAAGGAPAATTAFGSSAAPVGATSFGFGFGGGPSAGGAIGGVGSTSFTPSHGSNSIFGSIGGGGGGDGGASTAAFFINPTHRPGEDSRSGLLSDHANVVGSPHDGPSGKRRLGFCFNPRGNDILVWRTRRRDEREVVREKDRKEPAPPPSDAVWTAEIEAPLVETHKLFSEAHSVFMELQNFATEFHNRADLLREARKKSSKNYRVVINILINNLERKLKNLDEQHMDEKGDDKVKSEFSAQLALWKLAEIVWHLCDIFFISSKPDSIITESMVMWLQHFDISINNETKTNAELEILIRDIVSSPMPEGHESYWPLLYKLTLRGQISKALELLYAHSERRSSQIQPKRRIAKSTKNNIWLKMEVLLKQMPIFRPGTPRIEFEARWEQWRADCRSLQVQAESKGDNDLQILLSLMNGEESVLRDLSVNWQEFLIGKLLYSEPTTKNVEFRLLMEQVTRHFEPSDDVFEQILRSVINFEPYEVIHKCWDLLRWWFAAHLTDLLYHAGHIEDIQLDEGGDLREYLLLGFVRDELLSPGKTESMWHIAVNYLSFCPTFGKAYTQHLLERVPLESEKQAYKAVAVCAQHNLTDQAKLLFKIMGMQKYRERRYGASIQWFVRAAHPGRLAQVANKLVDDFYQGKVINAEEVTAVVEQLDKDFIFSDRLVFLSKVRELKRYQEQQNWRAVATLTVEVIAKNLAPRRYWTRLLREVVPLLEATPVLFDLQQTELLMAALEDITSAHYIQRFPPEIISSDELSAIRLALARNRARAVCL